jgi:hypothetical protein
MKRKVGTTIEEGLYRRVRQEARKQGRSVNDLFAEALERFLASKPAHASTVAETKGTFKVSRKVLRAVLEEDPYGPE